MRGVLSKQRKHTVIGHDRRRQAEQVIFQGAPKQTQGFKEKTVGIILGKTHACYGGGHVQAQVFDKAGCRHKAVQQRCRTQLAFDLVIKARP